MRHDGARRHASRAAGAANGLERSVNREVGAGGPEGSTEAVVRKCSTDSTTRPARAEATSSRPQAAAPRSPRQTRSPASRGSRGRPWSTPSESPMSAGTACVHSSRPRGRASSSTSRPPRGRAGGSFANRAPPGVPRIRAARRCGRGPKPNAPPPCGSSTTANTARPTCNRRRGPGTGRERPICAGVRPARECRRRWRDMRRGRGPRERGDPEASQASANTSGPSFRPAKASCNRTTFYGRAASRL